ncbi:MAG: KamA family radical SAM protein [Candidatus Neomarinimicrobiota bacterium]|nr:MAG: KamA family radical SAM protein [Candidatus Neomarinimicrobiota bacterium]
MGNGERKLNKISVRGLNSNLYNSKCQKSAFPKEISENDLSNLWRANPKIAEILKTSPSVNAARERLYQYLTRREKHLLSVGCDLTPLQIDVAMNCIRTLRNVISPLYESISDFSALEELFRLSRKRVSEGVTAGFVYEFVHLFRGISGDVEIYNSVMALDEEALTPREIAIKRSGELDEIAETVKSYVERYRSGLDEEIITIRKENREKILSYFGGSEDDWYDYRWHLRNIITDLNTLDGIVKLDSDEKLAIKLANKYGIPFGITPYYLSLMNFSGRSEFDFSIRAQVIPTLRVVSKLAEKWEERKTAFDFMKEAETSPVDLVTRRYPQIVILKPVSTCPQICTYCQRNWEIDSVHAKKAFATKKKIETAIEWIKATDSIEEVLVTGGDPFILSDRRLEQILEALSRIEHIKRIRIGTRMIVTLPFRITDSLVELVKKYHEFGKREIAIVTHVEHVSEITPELVEVTSRIKRAGLSIYNQEVFTFANSRRFESVALRKMLRLVGIDPYYTFNTKGKEETVDYMVPIARLLQERKEEVRLAPGLDRTDEPVFNVPGLGKNYLKSWQDHRVVMILPDGSRVYEFHPWEKNVRNADVYYYKDVPIYDYLMRLKHLRDEDINAYKSIWYYY